MSDFDSVIANEALNLAREWGKNLNKPIQERLALLHPELTSAELDLYNAAAQDAMKHAYQLIYEQVNSREKNHGLLQERCRQMLLDRYSWVSEKSFDRLFTIGMYYANR